MNRAIRLMVIGAPFKMHLHQSLTKYLSSDFRLKLLSADLCYDGSISFRKKSFGIWLMPTKRMIQELVRFHPDVVLTDYPAYPSWYAKIYSYLRLQHIPLLVWLLGDFWSEFYAYYATISGSTKLISPFHLFTWSTGLKFSDRILTVCKWLEKIVNTRFSDKATSVLYQGVDPDPWLVKDDSPYPFKHPAVGILQDNNILPKVKGLLWFSDVVKRMNDVHFYIAGGGQYTPLVEKAYAGLRNVHLVGRLPYPHGVRRFHMSTDVYVLPSGLDCCPTTLLEASLCTKPTIGSKIGGIPELVIEDETGWTIENSRTDQWVSTIRKVLEDADMSRRTGENARKFVMTHFSWSTQAAKLESIIRELVT